MFASAYYVLNLVRDLYVTKNFKLKLQHLFVISSHHTVMRTTLLKRVAAAFLIFSASHRGSTTQTKAATEAQYESYNSI